MANAEPPFIPNLSGHQLQTRLYNLIYLLTPVKATESKNNQASRDAPEPVQTVDFLPGHFDVHAPHTADDVHGQDNCTNDLDKKVS
jgi:hypothetical protein